jgi:hypothetical protein
MQTVRISMIDALAAMAKKSSQDNTQPYRSVPRMSIFEQFSSPNQAIFSEKRNYCVS